MPNILSHSSTSDESAPPRTEEIDPLPPLPRPPSSAFALLSTPPGMLPLKHCGVDDPTRVHPRDVVRHTQRDGDDDDDDDDDNDDDDNDDDDNDDDDNNDDNDDDDNNNDDDDDDDDDGQRGGMRSALLDVIIVVTVAP